MNSKACVAVLALLSSTNARAVFYGVGGQITRDGEYMVHTFTNASDSFTVTGSGEVEVLLVGGGGGGGAYGGGGGGGGQVVTGRFNLNAGTYPIVVGRGGAGAVASNDTISSPAENGGVTTAFEFAAGGGGGGGSKGAGLAGANGGGGGVGKYASAPEVTLYTAGGAATNEFGFSGGKSIQPGEGLTHTSLAAGGGGGAGGAGQDAAIKASGSGGVGVTNDFSGVALGYGGGGSGGGSQGTLGVAYDGGGMGGSGTATDRVKPGNPGADGFGGGGGGGGRATRVSGNGGNGGCGTVIVRYKPTMPEYFERIEVTGNYSYRRRRIDGVRYGLYTFTNDVSVKVTGNGYVDLLLVGGGGGGGRSRAGGSGGGGGGVVELNRVAILGCDEPYAITVGAGGAGGGVVTGVAENGGDTEAFGFIAHGGGAGGRCLGTGSSVASCAGADGACGGGAAPLSNSGLFPLVPGGKAIWPGEGFDGGCATNTGTGRCWGGGGGGAGGVGGDGVTSGSGKGYAGVGGIGRICTITGEADTYYGGGGGGGQCCLRNAGLGMGGAGGLGGGGNGSANDQIEVDKQDVPVGTSGFNGVDGLGGGGGGAGANPTADNFSEIVGGTGGCGVVILRVREEPQGLMIFLR